MIGLPKSSSFMPVARQRPRAPAWLRPWVVVRERYCGIISGSCRAARALLFSGNSRSEGDRLFRAWRTLGYLHPLEPELQGLPVNGYDDFQGEQGMTQERADYRAVRKFLP